MEGGREREGGREGCRGREGRREGEGEGGREGGRDEEEKSKFHPFHLPLRPHTVLESPTWTAP